MELTIIGGILAFIITFYAIPVIIKVADVKKLYDEPDDVRKLHIKPVPSFGGVGIFIGLAFSLLLTTNFSEVPEFQFYILSFLIIFFLGLKDDILVLSPVKKFCGQLIVGAILILNANLVITDMQGVLGIYAIDTTTSYILTLFTIVAIINAFNLIDGVDGLAGSIGLLSCVVFGSFFLINGNIPYAVLAFGFAGSMAAFLFYNFQPAKIFMGDTGSLLLGLVNSILVIKFIETAANYKTYPISAAPAVGFSIMLIPLMDTLRVFGIRIIKGRSPFSPDRNHIHHLLLNKGLSHKSVTLLCTGLSTAFIAIAFFSQGIGTTWLIVGLISCFFLGIYSLFIVKEKVNLRVIKGEKQLDTKFEETAPESVRLVSMFKGSRVAVKEEE